MKSSLLFGNLEVGVIPRVVAVIACNTDALKPSRDAVAAGADVLEFRADYCDEGSLSAGAVLEQIKHAASAPVLLTIRRLSEGGYFVGDENARLELFKSLIPHIDAVDVELYATDIRDAVIEFAHQCGKPVIASYHNFRRTPPLSKLQEVADDAEYYRADMVKIAVMARTLDDVQLLQSFTAKFVTDILLTSISMGDVGAASRILNPLLGSCLTYGFIGEQPTTPGQIPVSDLRRLIDEYRGKQITAVAAQQALHTTVEQTSACDFACV